MGFVIWFHKSGIFWAICVQILVWGNIVNMFRIHSNPDKRPPDSPRSQGSNPLTFVQPTHPGANIKQDLPKTSQNGISLAQRTHWRTRINRATVSTAICMRTAPASAGTCANSTITGTKATNNKTKISSTTIMVQHDTGSLSPSTKDTSTSFWGLPISFVRHPEPVISVSLLGFKAQIKGTILHCSLSLTQNQPIYLSCVLKNNRY